MQTLHFINIENVTFSNDGVVIKVPDRLQVSKPGKGVAFQLAFFPDKKLCVANCVWMLQASGKLV